MALIQINCVGYQTFDLANPLPLEWAGIGIGD